MVEKTVDWLTSYAFDILNSLFVYFSCSSFALYIYIHILDSDLSSLSTRMHDTLLLLFLIFLFRRNTAGLCSCYVAIQDEKEDRGG